MSNPVTTFNSIRTAAEKHTSVIVKESSSGRLLFTEYGARLLGLFPSADLPNTLWASGNLDQQMPSGSWMIGGERLWISPERNFFYENPRDFDGFHVPAEIDPGEYKMISDLTCESVFSLLNYSNNNPYDESIARREFALIDDPYQTGLAYAGVRINDLLSISSPDLEICAWSLAQIYTSGSDEPGTALFPIRSGGLILSYFNPIPSQRASIENGYARFRIDAAEIYKFSLQPQDMLFDNPAKAVYISPFPGCTGWFCIVKRCDDMPRSQADCVDPARNNPTGPRGATQAYNNGPGFDDGEVIPFGEIELQLSKGKTVDGRTVSKATHELLSYAGKKEEMLELAKSVLRIDTLPIIY